MSKHHHQNRADHMNRTGTSISVGTEIPDQTQGGAGSSGSPSNAGPVPSYEDIQKRAYQIHEEKGGSDLENWLEAERILKKTFLAIFLGLSLFLPRTFALADDHGGDVRQHEQRHSDHYYRNGHWYRHGWFGMEVSVPVLSAGVYVNTLPPVYTPVVVQGTTYYYADNTYFVASSDGGYTVVVPPNR